MPFYDIMLLYRTLEAAVEEEAAQQKKQEDEYKDQMPNMPDYKNFSNNINQQMTNFNMDSISKNYSMPSIPDMPHIPSVL